MLAVLDTMRLTPLPSGRLDPCAKLRDQTTLAGARGADHTHERADTPRDAFRGGSEAAEFRVPANELGPQTSESAHCHRLETRPQNSERAQRGLPSPYVQVAQGLELELPAGQCIGLFGDDDLTRPSDLRQAGSDVDRVSQDRLGSVTAQVAADDGTGRNPGVHAQRHARPVFTVDRQAAYPVLDRAGGENGPDSVVFMRAGHAKQQHRRVADELVDVALVLGGHLRYLPVHPAEEVAYLLGLQALGQCRERRQVRKDRRYPLPLSHRAASQARNNAAPERSRGLEGLFPPCRQ